MAFVREREDARDLEEALPCALVVLRDDVPRAVDFRDVAARPRPALRVFAAFVRPRVPLAREEVLLPPARDDCERLRAEVVRPEEPDRDRAERDFALLRDPERDLADLDADFRAPARLEPIAVDREREPLLGAEPR